MLVLDHLSFELYYKKTYFHFCFYIYQLDIDFILKLKWIFKLKYLLILFIVQYLLLIFIFD